MEQLKELEDSEIPIKPTTPCAPWTEEQILTKETNKVLQLQMEINSQTEKISLLSNRIKRAESKTDVVVPGPSKEQMKAAQEELGKDLGTALERSPALMLSLYMVYCRWFILVIDIIICLPFCLCRAP